MKAFSWFDFGRYFMSDAEIESSEHSEVSFELEMKRLDKNDLENDEN